MSIEGEWQAGEEPPEAPPPRSLRIAGHAVNVIALLGLIPAAGLVMASPFLFDAPGSESNPYVWMLAALFVTGPFVLLLAASKARKAARTGGRSTLWLATLLLALYPACFLAVNLLLNHFCDGNFSCR
jgi:hypothetical protein